MTTDYVVNMQSMVTLGIPARQQGVSNMKTLEERGVKMQRCKTEYVILVQVFSGQLGVQISYAVYGRFMADGQS